MKAAGDVIGDDGNSSRPSFGRLAL